MFDKQKDNSIDKENFDIKEAEFNAYKRWGFAADNHSNIDLDSNTSYKIDNKQELGGDGKKNN